MYLNVITVISFILSSWLAIDKILNMFIKPKVSVLTCLHVQRDVNLKIMVINKSDKQLFITSAYVVPKSNQNIKFCLKIYKSTLISNNKNILKSETIPINIPNNSAKSFYLSFQHETELAENFLSHDCVLQLTANGKNIEVPFNYHEVVNQLNILSKEIS